METVQPVSISYMFKSKKIDNKSTCSISEQVQKQCANNAHSKEFIENQKRNSPPVEVPAG